MLAHTFDMVQAQRTEIRGTVPFVEVLVDGDELSALVGLDGVPGGGVLLGPNDCVAGPRCVWGKEDTGSETYH